MRWTLNYARQYLDRILIQETCLKEADKGKIFFSMYLTKKDFSKVTHNLKLIFFSAMGCYQLT